MLGRGWGKAGAWVGRRGLGTSAAVCGGGGGAAGASPGTIWWGPEEAQGRDVVGFGLSGNPEYQDRVDYPYSAIRFRKNDPVILALREKEKGDWTALSAEEKKTLYRYSFRRTFAELEAPDGHWKLVLGGTLVLISTTIWITAFMDHKVYDPHPPTFREDVKEAQMWRMIDTFSEPITGIASQYDYANDQWKK